MGLNVVVGVLAAGEEYDEEGHAYFRDVLAGVNSSLGQAGLPTWTEAEDAESAEFEMVGYSGLHRLRRVAAHLVRNGRVPEPMVDDDGPARDDPYLEQLYAADPAHWSTTRRRFGRVKVSTVGTPQDGRAAYDHLIHHSDAEGVYVPASFEPVLVDEAVVGGYIGSAPRLLDECLRLAQALGLDPDLDPESEEVVAALDGEATAGTWQRYGVESFTCLQLIRAARRSADTGQAIVFT